MKHNKTFFNGLKSTPVTSNITNSVSANTNSATKVSGIEASTYYTNDMQCHLCHRTYLSKETRDRHLVTFHRIGGTSDATSVSAGTGIINSDNQFVLIS